MKFVPLGEIQNYLSYGFLLPLPTLRQNSEVKFCCWRQRSWCPIFSDQHTHVRCCMLVEGGVLATDPLGINSLPLSWRRKWQSTPVLLPGKSHGQRSLVDYSPWGRKESDTTERLHSFFQPSRVCLTPCPIPLHVWHCFVCITDFSKKQLTLKIANSPDS